MGCEILIDVEKVRNGIRDNPTKFRFTMASEEKVNAYLYNVMHSEYAPRLIAWEEPTIQQLIGSMTFILEKWPTLFENWCYLCEIEPEVVVEMWLWKTMKEYPIVTLKIYGQYNLVMSANWPFIDDWGLRIVSGSY